MDLLDHSRRLDRVDRWDWSRPFGGAGLLCLGSALGAVASDGAQQGVVALLVALGLALLLGSLFIRRERIESVENVKTDFDRWLGYWERNDATLQEMRRTYGKDPIQEANDWRTRLKRLLRL